MFTFSNYEPTYNKAIDFCANIIACGRAKGEPIKTLRLEKSYYGLFKAGVKAILETKKPEGWQDMMEKLDEPDAFQFDGVNIERAMFQIKPVVIEYYKPLAEA
jgi:hypothetical protein